MLVLFPSHPFDKSEPDPGWAEEVQIAVDAGHDVAFVHHESLVDEKDVAPRAVVRVPVPDPEQVDDEATGTRRALYRGWMLTAERYAALFDALVETRSVQLITHPRQYALAQNLPEWYPRLEGATPRTVVMPMHRVTPESVTEKVVAFLMTCQHGVVIKDFVKSRKHEWKDACFIPDGASAKRVVGNFLQRQGRDLQGGVVIREYVPLRPLGPHPDSGMPMSEEYRIFWLNGAVASFSTYWPEENYETEEIPVAEPEGGWEEGAPRTMTAPRSLRSFPDFAELAEVVRRVGVMCFTMDLAQAEDGSWMIMEVGDGGVSSFTRMPEDAQSFYGCLDALVHHVHDEPPRAPGPVLTRAQMDPMTCSVEGCDHADHQGGLVMHARCHVESPTWCAYQDGVLTVTCAECDREVARIAVAAGEPARD